MTLPNQFSAAVEGTSRAALNDLYNSSLTDMQNLLDFEEKLRASLKAVMAAAGGQVRDSLRLRVFSMAKDLQDLIDDTSRTYWEVSDLAHACEAELKACEGGEA
jgi:hypothetical protein